MMPSPKHCTVMCFVSVPVVWKLNLIKIYDMMMSSVFMLTTT